MVQTDQLKMWRLQINYSNYIIYVVSLCNHTQPAPTRIFSSSTLTQYTKGTWPDMSTPTQREEEERTGITFAPLGTLSCAPPLPNTLRASFLYPPLDSGKFCWGRWQSSPCPWLPQESQSPINTMSIQKTKVWERCHRNCLTVLQHVCIELEPLGSALRPPRLIISEPWADTTGNIYIRAHCIQLLKW